MPIKTIKVIIKGSLSRRSCVLIVPEDPDTEHRIKFRLQSGGEFSGKAEVEVTTSLNTELILRGTVNTDFSFEYQSLNDDNEFEKFDGDSKTIEGGIFTRDKSYPLSDL